MAMISQELKSRLGDEYNMGEQERNIENDNQVFDRWMTGEKI